MTKHTYDLGLIGTDTAVRGLCWPRFDSRFVFGSLLDEDKGGEYSIRPASAATGPARQYYRANTNVLCTEIETKDGCYRVTDFTPASRRL